MIRHILQLILKNYIIKPFSLIAKYFPVISGSPFLYIGLITSRLSLLANRADGHHLKMFLRTTQWISPWISWVEAQIRQTLSSEGRRSRFKCDGAMRDAFDIDQWPFGRVAIRLAQSAHLLILFLKTDQTLNYLSVRAWVHQIVPLSTDGYLCFSSFFLSLCSDKFLSPLLLVWEVDLTKGWRRGVSGSEGWLRLDVANLDLILMGITIIYNSKIKL